MTALFRLSRPNIDKRFRTLLRSARMLKVLLGWYAICTLSAISVCQNTSKASASLEGEGNSIAAENEGVAVKVDGRPILFVYAQIGGFTQQERANAIEDRILALAEKREVGLDTIRIEDRGTWTDILAGHDRIMGITAMDAAAAERDRAEMASEYVEIIRQVVKQYRQDHTIGHLLVAFGYTLAATAACFVILVLLFRVRRRLQSRVDKKFARAEGSRIGRYLGGPLLAVCRMGFWVLVIVLLQAYGTLVLRFFPATKYSSYQITNWILSALGGFGRTIIAYIPNLVLVAAICLVTVFLVKVNKFVFSEIRDEKLTIRGFYSDWAEPTAKLVRTLILIAAVIVAFPYLPGSESPAFKGISVFLGLLLSLGSTSAVAHAIAGTILTYMRAFQVQDFVRIGTDMGEVVEKTLLVTRIRTQKNEVITIPNGTVLGGVVMNYSAEGRKRGVIFHTAVSIGYSALWRQVHALLISAALETPDILHDPPPFVLQTALNDFYVSYELNAYTAKPMNMLNIYSMLHQNIQDKFNEAGVEINSPHYTSLRDGNETTIPQRYWPKDYKHPLFEFQQSGKQTATITDHDHATAERSG